MVHLTNVFVITLNMYGLNKQTDCQTDKNQPTNQRRPFYFIHSHSMRNDKKWP